MTVIICPACNTRFETAAVIPPTGRKVRCSKCGNVWQAFAVVEPAKPAVSAPMPPPMESRPGPMAPRPTPAAPPPAAAPRPAAPRPASPGPGAPMGRFPGAPAPAAPSFGGRENNGALPNGPAPAAARTSGPPFSTDDMQPDLRGDGSGFGGMGALEGETVQDLGSYNAGALVNPDAGLATNIPIAEGRERKLPPAVAIGWGALALLLVILAAMVAMAPKTVVSLLPGSTRLYAMMGMPVNTLGLSIENVRSAWNDTGPERVLQVDGDVVNLTAGEVKVPAVVISLEDASGKELSQFTTDVLPLGAGAKSPFTVQIPSPPENVSRLEVRFAKAE